MIRFSCPQCGKHLKAPADYAGKAVKCTRCGLSQPAPGAVPAATPTAETTAPITPQGPAPASAIPVATAVKARPRAKALSGSFTGWPLFAGIGVVAVLVVGVGLLVYFLLSSEVDRKLADLKSSDPNVSQPALEWLSEATPNDARRAKVTAAIEDLLRRGDVHNNLDPDLLLNVYLNWANQDNVPAMIGLVQTPPRFAWGERKTGQVMDALGKLQDERAAGALADELPDRKLHDQAVSSLIALGPKGEPAVLDYLFHPDDDVRERANQVLRAYGTSGTAIVSTALKRLLSPDAAAQQSAIVWFVDNSPSDESSKFIAGPQLAKLLDQLKPEVCHQALRALKQWATPDCLPQLQTYARREQKNPDGNRQLIEVLSQFKDERAADALAMQLSNPHSRPEAVKALANLGPVASKAVLRYINHPDEGVEKDARSLCRTLDISDARQLDQTLADVADPRIPRSRAALRHLTAMRPDEPNRLRVSQALNTALLDHDPSIRDAALQAALSWRTRENTDTLVKLLGDFQVEEECDPRVIELLAELKDPKAAPALAKGLTHPRDRERVSKALVAIGPAAEDSVLPFLQLSDRLAVLAVFRILGEIGTDKAVTPLTQAGDFCRQLGDFPMNNEAQLALQKIGTRKR